MPLNIGCLKEKDVPDRRWKRMLTEAEKERLLEIAEDLIRLKSDSGPGYEKAVGDYI